MRRVVVVLVLAGCFSKPGLRDRDGGDGGDGGDDDATGDGGGDGSMIDSPIVGCTWTPFGTILDDSALDTQASSRTKTVPRGTRAVGTMLPRAPVIVPDWRALVAGAARRASSAVSRRT